MARFLHISLESFAPATNSNCGDRSAVISFGPRFVNTLTRKQPEGWMGRRGRIDKALLAETCFPPQQNPKIFVCGSTPFVEDVSR